MNASRFTARRLPKQTGPAGWNRLLPDPGPTHPLEGDSLADVAIIGAGFAGLSAARRLHQLDPNLRVTVLEAGRVGEGPAGRNSGFMIDLPHDLSSDSYAGKDQSNDVAQTTLNRAAIAFAAQAAAELNLEQNAFDPCGRVNAAASAAGDHHNREYAAHLDAMGEPHELLDAAAMRALTGSRFYTSGLFTPGTVMIQPAAYVRALADALRARVCEASPVLEMTRKADAWELTTPTGKVSAPNVILAVNGHAESFGFFPRRLMHVFTYASMTEVLQQGLLGGESRWAATPADPMGTTIRRITAPQGDRIVVRSRFTWNPSMEVSEAAVSSAGRLHDKRFAERFPMLAGTTMQWRWAGHLCLSGNGMPGQGEVAPGLFAAVCQNGLGTVRGTLAGIAAAERVLGHASEITRGLDGLEEPSRLPPEPIASIGARATLKWKEWRAGRE